MQTKIIVHIAPFKVPEFVEELPSGPPCAVAPAPAPAPAPGSSDAARLGLRKFRISELPEETLQRLCSTFVREIYRKANRDMPIVGREGSETNTP